MPATTVMPAASIQRALQFREKLTELINIIHKAQDVASIVLNLKQKLLDLLDCERVTIYAVDARTQQVFSLYKEGEEVKEIRVNRSQNSIVGFCALTGQTLNIKDAYDAAELKAYHPNLAFDGSWDQKTGFRTRQLLTVPILYEQYLMGVLQLLNKRTGAAFTAEDLVGAQEVAKTLGIALYNRRRLSRPRPAHKFSALIEKGMISEKNFEDAMTFARMNTQKIGEVLVEKYRLPKEEVLKSMAAFYNTGTFVFDGSQRMPDELRQRLRPEYVQKIGVAPLGVQGGVVRVAVEDPSDLTIVDAIRVMQLAPRQELLVALEGDIRAYLNESYGQTGAVDAKGDMADILGELTTDEGVEGGGAPQEEGQILDDTDSAIVRLANQIIIDAYAQGASDIHVEPMGRKAHTRIRFRVDGECHVYQEIPAGHRQALVSRLKIMSNLDISERRKPQDGKIRFQMKKGNLELRVATIPTTGGEEDVVMRLLAASKPLPLDQMGFSAANLTAFKDIVSKPYGIILCVGPTGSGKTTTLHSALGFINTPDVKIWTAEDPVEITQPGLRQVQVQPKIDFTFAAAMRSFLRADPDVIMVGEMRDQETAQIGIEASLTGHLVLSTLHTNSAPETITRLIDMGIDPFNFADSLLGILAQRLTRTLCKKCKQPYHPSEAEFESLVDAYGREHFGRVGVPYGPELTLYQAQSCPDCAGTGYRGRMGLHELLRGTDTVKRLIQNKAAVEEIRAQAIADGMTTLMQDGVEKVLKGSLDMKQVRAVCMK